MWLCHGSLQASHEKYNCHTHTHTSHEHVDKKSHSPVSTPGFEPGLSRPQRDVLTTRRCGQQRSSARVALKICSLPGAVAAQGSRSRAWRAAGRRSAAEARGRLQFPVPHAQCSRPTLDIRSPARLHTDRCSKLPSDSLSPHLGNMFCEPPPTMSTPGFEPGLSRPQRNVLTTR